MARARNIYEIVNTMRHYGAGKKVTRVMWLNHEPDTYWELTRVMLKEGNPLHGKAWGRLYWKGVNKTGDGEERVRSPCKRQWFLLEDKPELLRISQEKAAAAASSS